ncbi:MAG: hypothetical protein EAZ97_14045 [Bacteroidetes bacterium]|nr:MAG: hypothetical protein EAZ97_14045 [Bacteroidota bacterium]
MEFLNFPKDMFTNSIFFLIHKFKGASMYVDYFFADAIACVYTRSISSLLALQTIFCNFDLKFVA